VSRTTTQDDAGPELAPDSLMRLATAFWTTKTVTAAVEFNLFGVISDARGMTVEDAAEALGIQHRPADLLLAACASLGLLHKNGDRYHNNEISEEFLVPGRDRYYGALFQYVERRAYPAWAGLVTALRTNRPVAWDPDAQDSVFSPEDRENVEVFWKAMHTISVFTARALSRALDLTSRHRLLDLGGGSATYGIELCRSYPHLFATSFDLPHVSAIAAQKIEEAGMADRVSVVTGDFFADAHLPTGHDVIVLSSILHDWDEKSNIGLLDKCFDALSPGGIVVVCESILNDDRTGPLDAALMGVHMLVETTGGKNYSGAEYKEWLSRAGFADIRHLTFAAPAANGVIVATRPRS
jgi:3-hydroxy-5-methyl-1-naphthoate 3-O-methyltransferase